ncbi:flavin reductase family protein [Cereibacter azotoformans]|uniref:flavin reductase family protein n=1 Tax=Cereibacter azotoformans TaxID=43057 RepID=UPI001EEB8B66|nr:flavin reductase family protein [Cereibacter azotoformans]ULB08935.1 flavin reductase family protein [Cereibacter azotoformans]
MFYRPEDGHGLAHNPFNAIVAPRPIGWISTRGPTGDNLAPYSFFNAVAYVPPQVMFASTRTKDSLAALRESGVFCVNIVEEAALSRMNATSAAFPRGTDEFREAGVDKAECRTIDCPRVGDAPASLECRVTQVVDLLGQDNHLVLGEVTGVHLRDDCLRDGRFDVTAFRPMARLGYRDYAVIRELIELSRPPGG